MNRSLTIGKTTGQREGERLSVYFCGNVKRRELFEIVLTRPRDDDVRVHHCGFDIMLEGRFDESLVLLQNAVDIASSFDRIASKPSSQSDVRVCQNEGSMITGKDANIFWKT